MEPDGTLVAAVAAPSSAQDAMSALFQPVESIELRFPGLKGIVLSQMVDKCYLVRGTRCLSFVITSMFLTPGT